MIAEIPSGLLSLMNKIKIKQIENYHIDLSYNGKGEGYTGEVVFIILTNKKSQEEKQFLVVKQQKPNNEKMDKITKKIYEIELLFYETIWPTLHKSYQETTGKSLNFITNYLGSSREDSLRLIMDNNKANGFINCDKTKSFNADHIVKLFKTYGVYHGISMAFKEDNLDEFQRLSKALGNALKEINTYDSMITNGIVRCFKEIQEYFDPVTEKNLIHKLVEYENKGGEKLADCMYQEDEPQRALLHGDCWSNNLMFKYHVSINTMKHIHVKIKVS